MSIGYAWITGRVIGPDGAGRASTTVPAPLDRNWVGDMGDASVVVTDRVVARLGDQGQVSARAAAEPNGMTILGWAVGTPEALAAIKG